MTAICGPGQNLLSQSGAELRTRRLSAGNEGIGVALALGGGFARGFAHLGVMEVLEQEQIPISAIAGTSIGGLLGAAYADGISIRDLCDLGRQVRVRDFIRFQRSPKDSPRNDRIGQFVREWFHASRVEELCIPTAIVTTDIDTCAPHVFTRGPLEVAIRASCAFPGLFPPVEYDGRMLADGCIAAPVPTAIAARMNALCVLGVAVSANTRNSSFADNGAGAARTLRRTRGLVLCHDQGKSARQSKGLPEPSWSRLADVLLEPEVHQISWDDFQSVDEAHAAGAEAMRHALPLVRELLDRRSQLRRAEENSGRLRSEMVS